MNLERSPFADAFAALAASDPSWRHAIGRPSGDGWIAGDAMREAREGPLHDLLQRIGRGLDTADRRTIAASFALRYGWASGAAIVPYLRARCVPDVALDNVSFRFGASGFFDRLALHEPRGSVAAGDPRGTHASMTTVADERALIHALRETLVAQSAPVVEALFAWAGFARRGTWGMLTSAWVSHVTTASPTPDDHRPLLPRIDQLFAGSDIVTVTRPRLHAVRVGAVTHLFQRRASCCRYYLLPQGSLCASCPLVGDAERLRRNVEWMESQASRLGAGGHA